MVDIHIQKTCQVLKDAIAIQQLISFSPLKMYNTTETALLIQIDYQEYLITKILAQLVLMVEYYDGIVGQRHGRFQIFISSINIISLKITIINNVISQSSGSVTLVDLGAGTGFDVSSYPGYQNFTVDNFIIVMDSLSISASISWTVAPDNASWVTTSVNCNKSSSYDQANGTLSASFSCSIVNGKYRDSKTTNRTANAHVYLLL